LHNQLVTVLSKSCCRFIRIVIGFTLLDLWRQQLMMCSI